MASRFGVIASAILVTAGVVNADAALHTNATAFSSLAQTTNGIPSQRFRSSDIVAPVLQVNSWSKAQVDNAPYIFLGAVYGEQRAGPLILDSRDLSLVYADQSYNNTLASDVQTINGTRYLTFWESSQSSQNGSGNCLIFDDKYRLKYNVTANGGGNAARVDIPTIRLTSQNTILLSNNRNIPFNCTSVGGPSNALLLDSGFQEIDLKTSKVLFEWSASKHFNLSDTFATYDAKFGVGNGTKTGFDFFHLNSVEKTEQGNYLISSKHQSSISLIDGKSGQPLWVLGGRRNQFKDLKGGNATNFSWQHDARFSQNSNRITMFDNHGQESGSCTTACHSRGLELQLDMEAMTVEVVHEYLHPQHINSGAMGGLHSLDNGNVIVSWGDNPSFVEYKSDGTPVLDVQRGQIGVGSVPDMSAYRVSKHQWKGYPTWPPSIAVDAPNRTTLNASVYLSWNGATEVASWAILASDSETGVDYYKNVIAKANRTGFETEVPLGDTFSRRYIGAAAVAKDGTVLGSTYVVDMENGKPVMLSSGITTIKHPAKVESVAAGAMGGSFFGISMMIYAVNYFRKKKPTSDASPGEYSKITGGV